MSRSRTTWSAPALAADGVTGAVLPSRYVGAVASGQPTTGTFAVGDFVIDQSGQVLVCTVAGTPGTWTTVGKPGISYLDTIGHSHAADGGATQPDFGMIHKVDNLLQPAQFRSCAIGGAVHSFHDLGNAALGDGGWGRVAQEYDRQDGVTVLPNQGNGQSQVAGYTFLTAAAASAQNSLTVADRTGFFAGQWIVVGKGTTAEQCQVAANYVSATGAGAVTLTANLVNSHVGTTTGGPNANGSQIAASDPVYNSPQNAGYLAKSQAVLVYTGGNDVPWLGPFAQGTPGTTLGASRGLAPLQNSLRFSLAQMRSALIYRADHPACICSTAVAWTKNTVNSMSSGTVSFPACYFFGNSYYTTTAINATQTFSTPPDFPGGTVVFFTYADNGVGAQWSFAVSGATTQTLTNALDTRAAQATYHNESTSMKTGCCYRITGLNAGVNTVVATVSAIGTGNLAPFLGWGIEAPVPPMMVVPLEARMMHYNVWATFPYALRAPVGAANTTGDSTQTVGAAGVSAGSAVVPLTSAITIGTNNGVHQSIAVFPGDTITVGSGATEETRRVLTVDSTTQVTADHSFVNAHASGQLVRIGWQDADIVGGGYVNTGDTQGATSVPGMNAAIQSVVNEFDSYVQTIALDLVIHTSRTVKNILNFYADGVHFNDAGGSVAGVALDAKFVAMSQWTRAAMGSPTVPMKYPWNYVYGDNGVTPATNGVAFKNFYSNYWTVDNSVPKTAYRKDMRTRQVFIRGSVQGTSASPVTPAGTIFQLPGGYRPGCRTLIPAISEYGPAALEVDANGNVYPRSNCTAGRIDFAGSFPAEG